MVVRSVVRCFYSSDRQMFYTIGYYIVVRVIYVQGRSNNFLCRVFIAYKVIILCTAHTLYVECCIWRRVGRGREGTS